MLPDDAWGLEDCGQSPVMSLETDPEAHFLSSPHYPLHDLRHRIIWEMRNRSVCLVITPTGSMWDVGGSTWVRLSLHFLAFKMGAAIPTSVGHREAQTEGVRSPWTSWQSQAW